MNPFKQSSEKTASGKQKEGKSTFRKINNFLHLWLGLISGIIVFVVCVTGCIWVFNEEITGLLQPETRIDVQQKSVIPPSQLKQVAAAAYPGIRVSYANYQQGRAINVGLGERRGPNITLTVHPYTGKIISKTVHKKGETDFFRWVLNGHRFLWLPLEIGRPIVNYATLVFVVLLITGLIWWYPKKWTKSTREKSFKIKWDGSFKRVNLDLHNVLGFYSLLFLLVIALTGMVWGIEWYSKGLYWATTGDTLPEYQETESDSLQAGKLFSAAQAMDAAWAKVVRANPYTQGFYYGFPDTTQAKSTIYMIVYPTAGQFYNNKRYTFDRHTLEILSANKVYDADYAEAKLGAKLRRMNYDIHVGSILGFPGKVLAFLSSLIGASLPVTGFIIWWNRKGFGKSKKKKSAKKDNREAVVTSSVQNGEPEKKPVFKPKMQKREVADHVFAAGINVVNKNELR